jgi:glutamate-ammonia-ligase adenylyltransferase
VDGYLAYLERHARLWEKQALLRAAPIAGDETLGRRFLLEGQPLIFLAGPEVARGDVYAMKQQTEAHLRGQGRDWGEVKLGEGSIRDVEFTAQYLQLAHGRALPALRTPNTLDALAQLAGLGCLAPDEQRVLAEGYVFLRTVEHALQILDYRQTHTLPRDAADLRYLAQRLGFAGPDAEAHFVARFEQHRRAVRSVYLRHLAGTADLPATPGGHAMNHPPPAPADLPPSSGQETVAVQSHRSRLPAAYAAAFSPAEIARHAALADRLSPAHVVEVVADLLGDDLWRVTVIGYDYLGELSLICGLLFVHGFSITDGYAFTYEPGEGGPRKIVDVFTVCALLSSECAPEPWRCYTADLVALLGDLAERRQREAQGELAKRVADTLRRTPGAATALHPIEITVDNLASDRYTVLRIEGQDTPGFLYEFTNALALDGVHIAQVEIATVGARVQDTLYVSDSRGRKITDPERERALRAATALVKHFTHLLPASPNPESALIHFHEYLGELFGRPSWPDELAAIERPAVLQALARLLGVSDFLWDDFLRMQYANLSPLVRDVEGLAAPRTRGALSAELAGLLAAAVDAAGRREALNAFKDREMFRVDMRHILGLLPDFGRFSAELTDLVETVVAAAAEMVHAELVAQHGAPLGPDGQPVPLVVCVLGKCGGYELGFASDIEVMFVYAGPGETAGLRSFSAAEFFDKLVAEFARAIWARRAGIFEIDLDLRPYGKAGSLSVSLDAFRRYFGADGPAWAYERQTLIKLRAIAGDADLGREVEALRDACVYTPAAFDLPALRAMRERQLRHLVTPPLVNVKYSLGGLVDVEYVVQGLQMRHGATHPGVRLTNTRAAIAALAGHGLISGEAAARLTEAHLFLQGLINALRVVRGNSKDLHAPADDGEDFLFLARRLGYGDEPARLRADLAEHLAAVQRLGKWLLG